jgi:hypothetical protein
MECAAGKMLHKTGLRMLQIECTGMKTPILGVCDRTRMKPYAVAANKQALIKFLGESIMQHYRLSSIEMSSGEVPYLYGASNHC